MAAVHEIELFLTASVEQVFGFFSQPGNLLVLAQPDLGLALVSGPAEIGLGARTVWSLRRAGVRQEIALEVVEFVPNERITERQLRGPFRSWTQRRGFERHGEQTRLFERTEFEGPGGLLGLMFPERVIRADLEAAAAYRNARLQELFGKASGPS